MTYKLNAIIDDSYIKWHIYNDRLSSIYEHDEYDLPYYDKISNFNYFIVELR